MQKIEEVNYNWGKSSPSSNIPVDNFSAKFDQSRSFSPGDYFIQTLADDSIRVKVDGQYKINRWDHSSGDIDQALWTNVSSGYHTIETTYYENTGDAAVFSHVVPFGEWIGYYYSNKWVLGKPESAKVIKPSNEAGSLSEDFGSGSPVPGKVPTDNFSTKYVTAKRLPAGDYVLRAKADDGIRVYVDGEMVIDRWTESGFKEDAVKISIKDQVNKGSDKDVHWIEVRYLEVGKDAKVAFDIEPYQEIIDTSEWIGEIYPNKNLTGNPVILGGKGAQTPLKELDFNWRSDSPHRLSPADNFSARFTKTIDVTEESMYQIQTWADDGFRVFVDGEKVIDSWRDGSARLEEANLPLSKGKHKIVVEYYESIKDASLKVKINKKETFTQKTLNVSYNWGKGSPSATIPTDYFSAIFDQSRTLTSGDYFIHAVADDRVKVAVNGSNVIDQWENSSGEMEKAILPNIKAGSYDIKTYFYENTGDAAVFSHVVPFGEWIGYYYSNKWVLGKPESAKVIKPSNEAGSLSQDFGSGSPVPGKVPTDNFSTKYVTAKRLPAGDYVLRAKADDGIRVYVDGEMVIDRWTESGFKEDAVKISIKDQVNKGSDKDVHWIEVRYLEVGKDAKVAFDIEPYQETIDTSEWIGEIYPNKNLTGNPVILGGKGAQTPLKELDFNWRSDSPHRLSPADNFSARFTKTIDVTEESMYQIQTWADDGFRVFVDGEKVIDSWRDGSARLEEANLPLSKGKHKIVVEYYESIKDASLKVKINKKETFTQKTLNVSYNWGKGSPSATIPTDYFSAIFDQSRTLTSGDYFIHAVADDRVKVAVNGSNVIDQWENSSGEMEKAILPNIKAGSYDIKTYFYENTGDAAVFSHVVPFGEWIGYYYSNKWVLGKPESAKVIKPSNEAGSLSEDFGSGSPVPGKVPTDNFSTKYVTAKRLPAGDYVLRAKADDGIRVYVDGEMVIDRWTDGNYTEDAVKVTIKDQQDNTANKDIHWIEVRYLNNTGTAKFDFVIEPYKEVLNTDQWVGEIYPTKNLTGIPVILGGNGSQTPIYDIDFNWQLNSPHALIPADNFSARFTKTLNLSKEGTYKLKTSFDDGVRAYVDNKLVIDQWKDGSERVEETYIPLLAGKHVIVVEYYDSAKDARLKVDVEKYSDSLLYYEKVQNVSYNWKAGSPSSIIPSDNFTALFDQSREFDAGNYFIQTLADDTVRVEVDGQDKINQKIDSSGSISRALWTNVSKGYHSIKTHYSESTGDAALYSHVVPLNDWVAYYYQNEWVLGKPEGSKVLSSGNNGRLYEDFGSGSPIPNIISNDNFSARYVTAKQLPAGDYVFRTKADDGIRVYVDGEMVLDRWTESGFKDDDIKVTIKDNSTTKDIHWIEVRYLEKIGDSKIDFQIQPYSEVIQTENWVGEIYSNKTLSGIPVILGGNGTSNQITNLDFSWGLNSPHRLIPSDNFSARFTKRVNLGAGTYILKTTVDDGVRIFVNGNKVVDSWQNGSERLLETNVILNSGKHEIVVEYFESEKDATLKFELINITSQNGKFVSSINLPLYRSFEELSNFYIHLPFYNSSYTRLDELGYGELVYILEEKQYGARVQTVDGNIGWVHKDYLENNLGEDYWLVKEGRNFRDNPGTSGTTVIGSVSAGEKVKLLEHKSVGGTYSEWYRIETQSGQRGWIWGAISTDGNQGYNLIKYEFDQVGKTVNKLTPFTPINTVSNVTADQINRYIDSKTNGKQTSMTGMGQAYIEAQKQSGLNAIYLLAHSGLETGWGTSGIVKDKYNYYGIGAIDSKPAEGAYNYSTKEGGIIAGAIWISNNYVVRAWDKDDRIPYYQPTLDNMRNDNSWHQYAADEAWAVKIAYNSHDFYQFINK
ncbi:PA14 domain-containing protein [Bacillus weihaiensis]|uniref:Beta-N-acetylglucosaminidase n=1 Tax=Bacillus weihaiensis TaxID=1547283 RepID=A0A1L3MMH6_9BACI|nr:PA14 domain-containing protein [Bacillus weihaiensis]APH03558.1 hypothetical protein A9C19_01645 [Bacillus weihaiensis]